MDAALNEMKQPQASCASGGSPRRDPAGDWIGSRGRRRRRGGGVAIAAASRLLVHLELARCVRDGEALVVTQIVRAHDEALGGVAAHVVLAVSPVHVHPDHVLLPGLHGGQVRFVLCVAHLHLQPKRRLVADLGGSRHGDDRAIKRVAILLRESPHARNQGNLFRYNIMGNKTTSQWSTLKTD